MSLPRVLQLALSILIVTAACGGEAFSQASAESQEQRIRSLEAALLTRSREAAPWEWATTQNNLGVAYLNRTRGEPVENIERAIKAFEAALTVWSRERFPRDWVVAQRHLGIAYNDLGIVYSERKSGERAENFELAIKAFEAALAFRTREGSPREWASTQNNLGIAYSDRVQGERALNVELAIKAFEAALTVRTREKSPREWASTQNSLGVAYLDRQRGDRAENVELAIKAFEGALTVWTREGSPQEWARAQANLGVAYSERIHGDRAENAERTVRAFEAALSIRTRESAPREWATTQNSLGVAYLNLIRGERAENVELAIKAFEAALTVRRRDDSPWDWALTQNNLGIAYADRIRGERADNIELAIEAFEAALTVRTRDDFPREWALTQNSLGVAYSHRHRDDRTQNLHLAIKSFKAALTVFTRDNWPQDWASAQRNLGMAYLEPAAVVRTFGGARHVSIPWSVEAAIKPLEAALTVLTREAMPRDWALAQYSLGLAYMASTGDLQRAIKAFEAALTVFTREDWPRDHVMSARLLGNALLASREWAAAAMVLAGARQAFLVLFGQGLDEAEALDLVERAGPLFAEAAYAAAQMGQADAALDLLNEGKGRLMAVALRQQSLDLSQEDRILLDVLKSEIRELTRRADATAGIEGIAALERLRASRGELLTLVEKARTKDLPQGGAKALALALVPEGGAIVAPIVTESGGKALIMASGRPQPTLTVLDLPELNSHALLRLMPDWLKEDRQADTRRWFGMIDSISGSLWGMFAARLDAALREHGVRPGGRLVWMPMGDLGLLPIGLARDPATGRRFADNYEIVNAPNLEALAAAARRVAEAAPYAALAQTVNPAADIRGMNLPFAEIEGVLVAAHFSDRMRIRLDRSNATPDAVMAALRAKTYWHFSTHGRFDWNDPRSSGLVMKGNSTLSVGALLSRERYLGRPRLVVLSACETGLYEANRNPDEFIGLPSAFLQMGAAGVIATLWKVDDLATALLMAKFYDLHFDERLPPATALKRAQVWLRDVTGKDLITYVKAAAARAKVDPKQLADFELQLISVVRSPASNSDLATNALSDRAAPNTRAMQKRSNTQNARTQEQTLQLRPFAHPYYWGGFFYTGL